MRRLCHEHLEDRSLLAVLTVDSFADSGDGSLRWAIGKANTDPEYDTIQFAEALADKTITLTTGQLQITSDLTINGLGADQLTISGNNSSRIFLVDDGDAASTITVSISGLSLKNGFTRDSGGAIFNGENLTVEDCTLADNTANRGGGIYNHHQRTLTVNNSTLTNNSADRGGGICSWYSGTLTVNNSTLADNSANYGGGIFNSIDSTLTVTNSTFDNNLADRGGGICSWHHSTLTVTDSTLADNSASFGGGIFNSRNSTLTVTNSTLTNNSAGRGGGICSWYSSTLTVNNSTLTKNSAGRGGGIFNSIGSTLTVTDSTLANNSAGIGGGIFNGYSSTLAVTNSTLANNSANNGGGIYNLHSTLTVTNSTLADNSANYGGGIWNNDSTLTVTDSTLADNSANRAGGGIYNHFSTLTVTDSTLANNSSIWYHGGGIYNLDATLTVTNSTLAHNSADQNGGGIYNSIDSTLTVTDSTLANNSASYGGGIFNSSDSTLTVTNSTLVNNSATLGGGGGIANAGPVTVHNSLLGGNTAPMGPDVVNYGTITAAYNVIQNGADSDIVDGENGNQVGVDPLLDPAGLQDNGGPTQTIALMPGSPAINAGKDELAVDADGDPLVFDQRGPGFDRFVGTVDIGAFEVQNQPPVAVDDEATTAEDVAVVIDVLANDWDPDGDPLTVIAVTEPEFGSAVINADYTISYTPAIDFNGVDSFMYTLSDGRGGTDTATVTVTVLSATEQIQAMQATIQHLFDEGVLNRGQARSLSVKLDQIQRRLDTGQTHVALNQLNAFTNHVTDLIAEGVLTEEEGQLLLDAAEDLRTSLTVTEDEAAVDVALADDELLADVLPSAASA